MNKSDDISLLATAMVKAQPQVKTALMDSVNPFFKSKYADLGAVWDAVREALQSNGLTVTQFPDNLNNEPALTTMLIHESGQWLAGTYPLMVTDKEHTPQGYGSALTYARRYGLSAVMGVIADTDDDGNAASGKQKPSQRDAIHTPHTMKPDAKGAAELYAPSNVQATANGTLTPQAWAQMGIERVNGFKTLQDLDAFEKKFAAKIVQIAPLVPDLHASLVSAMADRRFVLEAK